MERKRRSIVLISEAGHWANACMEHLRLVDDGALRRDPSGESILPDEAANQVFVVPVPGPGSRRFDLVRKATDAGGKVIVLAGSNLGETNLDSQLASATFCLQKSLEFLQLIELVRFFVTGRTPSLELFEKRR